jgi:5-methylcytosine-specific restriction endonuclease McrA
VMDDFQDSEAVLQLKAELADTRRNFRCSDDWKRKYLHKRIRSQRLAEARARGTHTEEQWLAVLDEFDYRCVQCGCWPVGRPCKDHIKPIYAGGSDGIDNLQPLCRECNTAKGPDCFNWADYRRRNGFEAGDE